jgi:hypothetical protein
MGRYDLRQVNETLDKVLAVIGSERFSSMRLLELEKVVRLHDTARALPAKTVLRAAINSYRTARWPGTAPKPAGRRSY